MKPYGLPFLLFFVSFCSQDEKQLVVLDFEKDLVTEGIAVDESSSTVFFSSLRKNKIVSCKLDGSNPGNFIEPNEYGYLSGFGMIISGDTLLALSNTLPVKNNRSILLMLNKNSGELINSYQVNDTSFMYLNDLALSSRNHIYITDSENNRVYTLNRSTQQLEIFIEDDQITYSNGVSISEDDKYLYLATYYNGIRVVDLATKKVINEANEDFGKIDGMKFYKNGLIGISNGRNAKGERVDDLSGVFRYYLNDERTEILRKEKIIPYEDYFGVPTTFDIINDYIYFIVNSQLDNFNSENNQITDIEKLRPYMLLKKKIQ